MGADLKEKKNDKHVPLQQDVPAFCGAQHQCRDRPEAGNATTSRLSLRAREILDHRLGHARVGQPPHSPLKGHPLQCIRIIPSRVYFMAAEGRRELSSEPTVPRQIPEQRGGLRKPRNG